MGVVAFGPRLAVRPSAQSTETVDFARDVQPLFRANCYGCHGRSLQNGNLRLDRRRDVMPNRVGANGARVVPGNSGSSRLYLRIAGSTAGLQMPPTGPLPPEQIAVIKTWIDQGAEWPDTLAGDTPSPPQDPDAVRLIAALRSGQRAEFDRVLHASPRAARSKGPGGSSPLMFAALYSDAHTMGVLLDNGADPNATNDVGAAPLLWAVDDAEKTRLLLSHAANPNVRSEDGVTPLMLAAGRFGASDTVKALLDGGAKIDAQPVFGRAASAGDVALMRLLLERGAGRAATPRDIQLAMRSGCAPCADLLIESAGPAVLNRALVDAAELGDAVRVRMLLEHGAAPSTDVLRLASSSDRTSPEAVKQLLDRGVRDDDALRIARGHGDTDVVRLLRAVGAVDTSVGAEAPMRSTPPFPLREAIERALPVLQHADVVFLRKAGCVSCHNNSLFQMTTAIVRSHGFHVDEATVATQQKVIGGYIESWRERMLQDIPIPGAVDTISSMLAGLAAARYPSDPATDAMARYLVRRQGGDGAWRVITARPPIESSDFAVTALSIRGLLAYAPPTQAARYAQSIRRAALWLRSAQPRSTEDQAFQILGLSWAREDRAARNDAVRKLIALQRRDGGWSQLPTLESDAYATGESLTALAESGFATDDSIFRRGVSFLLRTQLEDGSWYVRSRAVPIQPYFDSEFPHAHNQFISAAATNWATMALARADTRSSR